MQQFFAEFPSIMQTIFQAALPDVKTVLLKILLLVPFTVFEIWADKKVNVLKTTHKRKIKFDVLTSLAVLFFFTVSLEDFFKLMILLIISDTVDLLHSFWRKKRPGLDIW